MILKELIGIEYPFRKQARIGCWCALVLLPFVSSFAQNSEKSVLFKQEVIQEVDSLKKAEIVTSKFVGKGGWPSKTYLQFERLCKVASEEELVSLTNHESAIVRVYAFWGLAKRHYESLSDMVENHLTDTAKVEYMEGCLRYDSKVNLLLLDIVTKGKMDRSCLKLKRKTIENYRKRI